MASYLGLSSGRVILLVAALSGGLAGLAGAGEIAGLNHRLEAGVTQDLGYTAILVVSLGLLRPWFTAVCALLVAGLLLLGIVGLAGAVVAAKAIRRRARYLSSDPRAVSAACRRE